MTQSRKLLGALGIVFGLAVLTFAITAGSTHQAFGQQTRGARGAPSLLRVGGVRRWGFKTPPKGAAGSVHASDATTLRRVMLE